MSKHFLVWAKVFSCLSHRICLLSHYHSNCLCHQDAYYETDAVIDHLISHPNTAPFVSKQLIQHLGISNPSPRYVESVATAFKTGTYVSNGITFGDGTLSDLKATVAAILLDREATSNTLDADPSYGGIKEPIIKVLQFMRAMGYVNSPHDR